MENIDRFLTCIEQETCKNTKTDLIHNMYYHIFEGEEELVKKLGKFTISQQIKGLEAQGINMSFWKAMLAKVDWVPSYYTCVSNTVQKLLRDIDSEKDPYIRANYQYILFYTIMSHPQLYFMGINRRQFIMYMYENSSTVEKYTGNSLDFAFKVINGNTTFFYESYKELVCNINKLIERLNTMDPNKQNQDGETLLMEAVRWRQDDAMLYLAHLEVDPNIQNHQGKTALFMTCGKLHKGKWSYIPVLLGLGGDPDIKTNNGKDLMSYAKQHYAYSTINALNQ